MKVDKRLISRIFDTCVEVLRDFAEAKRWNLNEREINFICRKASRNPLKYRSILGDELRKRNLDPTDSIGITRETLEKLGWMSEEYSVARAVETTRGEVPLEEGFMEFEIYDTGLHLVLDGKFIKDVMDRYGFTEDDWEELESTIADMALEGRIPTSAIIKAYVLDSEDAEDLLKEGVPVLQGMFSGYTIDKNYWREALHKLWEKWYSL